MKKLLFLILFLPALVHGRIITTIAGNGYGAPSSGGYSGDNGPATDAELYYPEHVAADNYGNVYIADQFNRRVRKVDPTGIITTIAGNGIVGCSGNGGLATAAVIGSPTGITVDKNGNLFIADGHCFSIRKINTSGIITTIAGNGLPGYSGDGGQATAAMFRAPVDVAVDTAGNIYVADATNFVVRKIDVSGIISTIAGTGVTGFSGIGGPATAAMISEPSSVATDNAGNIYIADYGNQRIYKVDNNGIITTIAGQDTSGYGGDGGPATIAKLNEPTGVKADNHGNVFIADSYGRIRKIDASGIINTVAGPGTPGSLGDGGPATAAYISVYNLALDTFGNIYIADFDGNRIRLVSYGNEAVQYLNTIAMDVNIWPNPSSHDLFISASDKITRVDISNIIGQIIYKQESDALQVVVDVSDFPGGIYVVQIIDAYGRRVMKKIVKQ